MDNGILNKHLNLFADSIGDVQPQQYTAPQVTQAEPDAMALSLAREAKIREAQEIARQKSMMEAAAQVPQPQAAPQEQLSSWNPFVLLFGQPGDPNSSGIAGNK